MSMYMNGYLEHSRDTSIKAKKYKLEDEMLKEKITKGNMKIEQIIDATSKRIEDAEVGLQRTMEKNSKIKSIQEAQVIRIKKP